MQNDSFLWDSLPYSLQVGTNMLNPDSDLNPTTLCPPLRQTHRLTPPSPSPAPVMPHPSTDLGPWLSCGSTWAPLAPGTLQRENGWW